MLTRQLAYSQGRGAGSTAEAGDAKPRLNEFHKSLILTVFDKLILGALIVVAGYALNLALQKHQSHDTFNNEIVKTRVQEVGAAWAAINTENGLAHRLNASLVDYLAVTNHMVDSSDSKSPATLRAETTQLFREWDAQRPLTERALWRSQFWVGDGLFGQYERYHGLITDLVDSYLLMFAPGASDDQTNRAYAKSKRIEAELKRLRPDALRATVDLKSSNGFGAQTRTVLPAK